MKCHDWPLCGHRFDPVTHDCYAPVTETALGASESPSQVSAPAGEAAEVIAAALDTLEGGLRVIEAELKGGQLRAARSTLRQLRVAPRIIRDALKVDRKRQEAMTS